MSSTDPIEGLLGELRHQLRYDPLLVRRVLHEVAEHLGDAASAEQTAGASPHLARQRAVERFGPPDAFVRALPQHETTLRVASLLAASATVGIGGLILTAVAWLTPPDAPGSMSRWTVTGVGILTYGAMTWLYFVSAARSIFQAALMLISLAALVGGVALVGQSLYIARVVGDWEGYVTVAGLILAAHGTLVSVYLYCSHRVWSPSSLG